MMTPVADEWADGRGEQHILENPRADRVRSVRALAGRSARLRAGRFVVEGPQAVREAVAVPAVRVHDVYLTAASAQRYPEIVRGAKEGGIRLYTGSAEVLDAM